MAPDPIKQVVEGLNEKTEHFWKNVVNSLNQSVINDLRDRFDKHGYYGFRDAQAIMVWIDEIGDDFSGFKIRVFPHSTPQLKTEEGSLIIPDEEFLLESIASDTIRKGYMNIMQPHSLVDFINVLRENGYEVYWYLASQKLILTYRVR